MARSKNLIWGVVFAVIFFTSCLGGYWSGMSVEFGNSAIMLAWTWFCFAPCFGIVAWHLMRVRGKR